MIANDMDLARNQIGHPDQLVMDSQLSEMERLPAWVESIAATYAISESVKFAINLCLEEVISNVIRHGYSNRSGQLLTVHCAAPRPGRLVFTVEDDAAPFNPLEVAALPSIGEQDESRIGGQGIRLLRGFADTVEYEAKPAGNRLYIGFLSPTTVSPN